MEQYLIDTNVVSDYLSASFPAAAYALLDSAIDAKPNISVITQIELLCWNSDEATIESVKQFIADSKVLDISPEVVLQCVTIRRGKKIKTPDAIIAATALVYGYTLITGNERDFSKIKGLKVLNPHRM
jgi:predicted nucleic acid-binding protein